MSSGLDRDVEEAAAVILRDVGVGGPCANGESGSATAFVKFERHDGGGAAVKSDGDGEETDGSGPEDGDAGPGPAGRPACRVDDAREGLDEGAHFRGQSNDRDLWMRSSAR